MHFAFFRAVFGALIYLTAASPVIPPSAISPRPVGESFNSVVPVGIIKSSVDNTDDSPSQDIEPIQVVYFNKTSIENATGLAESRRWECGAGFSNPYFHGDYTTIYIRDNNDVFFRSVYVNIDCKCTLFMYVYVEMCLWRKNSDGLYRNNDFTVNLHSPPLCEGKYTFPIESVRSYTCIVRGSGFGGCWQPEPSVWGWSWTLFGARSASMHGVWGYVLMALTSGEFTHSELNKYYLIINHSVSQLYTVWWLQRFVSLLHLARSTFSQHNLTQILIGCYIGNLIPRVRSCFLWNPGTANRPLAPINCRSLSICLSFN